MLSSNTLIHTSTTVYDFNYITVDKTELLQRIQYWKDYFTQHRVTSVNLLCYQGITQTAIMFACFEKSISINITEHHSVTASVDMAIIGYCKKQVHNDRNSKSVLIADNLQLGYHGNSYKENEIDIQAPFIINGTDVYTVGEFIYAGLLGKSLFSIGQNIATIQHISNLKTNAVWLLSPVLAGTNIYACAHLIDLSSLLYKGIVDVVGLYPMHLHTLCLMEQNINKFSPFGKKSFAFEFNNTTIMTTGKLPPPDVLDWALMRGAQKIQTIFVADIAPLFVNEISSSKSDLYSRTLGTLIPGIDYTLNRDNELLIKYLDKSDDLWHNTKNVVDNTNGQLVLKGKEKINNLYISDIEEFLCGTVLDTNIGMSDFEIKVENNCLQVLTYREYVYEKFCSMQDTLTRELLNFSNLATVQYYYVDKSQTYKI